MPAGSSISLAAKGAALGDAFGNALVAHLSIQDTVENALLDIATGQYQVGVPITSLPQTTLFGEHVPGFTVNVDTLSKNNAGAIFTVSPGSNVHGPSNTLNAGDSAVALGAAAGTAVLNVTDVASPLGNPALAASVTLTGIATANILNTSSGLGGFSGNITGLTTINMLAGTNGNLLVGPQSAGLNSMLTNIGLSANSNLTAWIADTALAPFIQSTVIALNGVDASLDLLSTNPGVERIRDRQYRQHDRREHLRLRRELCVAGADQRDGRLGPDHGRGLYRAQHRQPA